MNNGPNISNNLDPRLRRDFGCCEIETKGQVRNRLQVPNLEVTIREDEYRGLRHIEETQAFLHGAAIRKHR